MSIQSHKDRLKKLEAKTSRKTELPIWYVEVVSPNPDENQKLKLVDGELVEISDQLDALENLT